jgi:DNA-binding transcriptional LysR family regulator
VNVELRHLRYFVAVAEELSFTAGARRVHTAQQVLSTQIRQLEEAIGVQLFERSPRGVALTRAGEAFLDGAQATLAALDRSIAMATHAAASVEGTLAVGLNVAASGDTATAILARFRQMYPLVRVKLTTYDLDHPAAGLLDHSTDVAIVRPPILADGIEVVMVDAEDRVFVLPAGHPLAGRDTLRMSDVVGEPWVAAVPAVDGCAPEAWRNDWLMEPRPDGGPAIVGATARTLDEWRESVASKEGISLCPASAERYYARPGLAFVPAVGVPQAQLAVGWRTGLLRDEVRRFIDCLSESQAPMELA